MCIRDRITDHHLPADELPAADCIVNPNQPGCGFPSKCIAGVGVMFYVMLALRAELRERGWFAEGSGRKEQMCIRDRPSAMPSIEIIEIKEIK